MPTLRAAALAALAAPTLLALPAAAEVPPLGQVPEITEGLIATAIAYEVGRRCEGIDARRLQGIAYLLQLQSRARELGFSSEEIDAYIEDEAEQDRLEAIARERLRAMGAVEGEAETYCAVGRAEIAAGSAVGQLLDD